MIPLGISVRRIMLQFCFSNPELIPPSLRRSKIQEELHLPRRPNGTLIIKPTEKCSIEGFPNDIEVKYKMVDAFYRKRVDGRDPSGKKKYHMVCFIFARRECLERSNEFNEFQKRHNIARDELQRLCKTSLWRVRLFKNKFYKDGREINGQCALSVNLDVRQPLFDRDGRPVINWQKDNNGNRIGRMPVPIKAEHDLSGIENIIHIKEV